MNLQPSTSASSYQTKLDSSPLRVCVYQITSCLSNIISVNKYSFNTQYLDISDVSTTKILFKLKTSQHILNIFFNQLQFLKALELRCRFILSILYWIYVCIYCKTLIIADNFQFTHTAVGTQMLKKRKFKTCFLSQTLPQMLQL